MGIDIGETPFKNLEDAKNHLRFSGCIIRLNMFNSNRLICDTPKLFCKLSKNTERRNPFSFKNCFFTCKLNRDAKE